MTRLKPDDIGVLERVHAVMHAFRSQQYRALDGGDEGITHMESKVLGFFAHRPGATQRDLSLHSGRDKAQLARLIKGLRDRGYLDAEADAEDRRNLQLRLTEAGHALQRTLRRAHVKLEGRAVDGLDPGERQQLADLLDRVRTNLEST